MLGKTRVPGWSWLLQRVSAALLLLGLGMHFLVLHYVKTPGGNVLAATDSTMLRFVTSTRFWVVFDGLLLALVLYHGLNGLHNIVKDYAPGERARKVSAWTLWLVGLAACMLGVLLLGKFVGLSAVQG